MQLLEVKTIINDAAFYFFLSEAINNLIETQSTACRKPENQTSNHPAPNHNSEPVICLSLV